jgi:hypothetical protein
MTEKKIDVSRRENLNLLLGVLGGAAGLAACANPKGPADEPERTDTVASGLAEGNIVAYEFYADLRANPGCTVDQCAFVEGNATVGDGGAGIFRWTSDTTTADNNGTVIVPSASPRTGCWKRLFTGPVNVQWFGTTDAAIRAAVAALPSGGGAVYLPSGTYTCTGTGSPPLAAITLANVNNVTIYGDGNGSTLTLAKNVRLMNVSNVSGLDVYGLRFVGTLQTDGWWQQGNGYQGQIALTSASSARIHHNRWENIGSSAVQLVGGGNVAVSIDHNEFYLTHAGVQGGGSTSPAVPDKDISITDNYFLGNITGSFSPLIGSDDQIAWFGSYNTEARVVIARNVIDKQGPSAYNQAHGIYIQDNTNEGIRDVIITDNVVQNVLLTSTSQNGAADRPAIAVSSSGGGSGNVTISGNVIRNVNEGIYIDQSAAAKNIAITNNQISQITTLAGGVTHGEGIRAYANGIASGPGLGPAQCLI